MTKPTHKTVSKILLKPQSKMIELKKHHQHQFIKKQFAASTLGLLELQYRHGMAIR
uniref:Uncharacterized protein n=1 Tax=Tetranychus urticae TaxID=32264 RepID=T1JPN3_TETUR